MGRSLTLWRRLEARLVVALAFCLLAPPLLHNHAGEKPAPVSHTLRPCAGHGTSFHWHAAETDLSPECPACAAGPSPAGLVTQAPAFAFLAAIRGTVLLPLPACSCWVRRHSVARALPALLVA